MFPLLDLPREIRDQIYTEYLNSTEHGFHCPIEFQFIDHERKRTRPTVGPALWQTCKQVRCECAHLYYTDLLALKLPPSKPPWNFVDGIMRWIRCCDKELLCKIRVMHIQTPFNCVVEDEALQKRIVETDTHGINHVVLNPKTTFDDTESAEAQPFVNSERACVLLTKPESMVRVGNAPVPDGRPLLQLELSKDGQHVHVRTCFKLDAAQRDVLVKGFEDYTAGDRGRWDAPPDRFEVVDLLRAVVGFYMQELLEVSGFQGPEPPRWVWQPHWLTALLEERDVEVVEPPDGRRFYRPRENGEYYPLVSLSPPGE